MTSDQILKAAGLWPWAPLTGPMAQGSVFPGEPDAMDYRSDVSTQTVVYDPGWWRRLPKPVKKASGGNV